MAECWEAYSLNKNVSALDDHSFPAYRLQLIKESDVEMVDENGAVMTNNKKRDAAPSVITPAHNGKRHQGSSSANNGNNESSNSLMIPMATAASR